MYLVVGNHDQALWKHKLDPAVLCLSNLLGHRGVAADADYRGTPPMCHCCDENTKGLFRQGHVGIVNILVHPVKGKADELCQVDTEGQTG